MIHREMSRALAVLAKGYPILAVTGPRQSGKTTLSKAIFPKKPYISMEDPDELELARNDPRGFLSRYPDGAILDEIQRTPHLLSYLQTQVDQDGRMGLFVLTGSQQFGLMAKISQSLAGRVGMVQLLPFSLSELESAKRIPPTLEELMFRGSYPPLYSREVSPQNWYASYMMTYIERDLRQILNVHDLSLFQKFVRMCAARTGQLLNLSSLSNDCGISHNTAKAWLSALEASYILFLLTPYHRNFNKRLVKTPKLYFYDTGLASWLLGIQKKEEIVTHAMRGALFETWVLIELAKGRFNAGLTSNLYFWRDNTGHEVDVLIENGSQLIPIEIKSGQTLSTDYFKGLEKWYQISGEKEKLSYLVYAGAQAQPFKDTKIIPWRQISKIAES
ncbi:MAG: ATP-binding protein [Chlamydiae bacterium]|nr:ATP-binding protein [Chlamydiota bacterium]MBI3276332.1 ATP-binding protein [Chlamydiota bacterium]